MHLDGIDAGGLVGPISKGPAAPQMQPKRESLARKSKEMQGKLIGFPFISLVASGLFNGLQEKK
jgi:hypothetical protein